MFIIISSTQSKILLSYFDGTALKRLSWKTQFLISEEFKVDNCAIGNKHFHRIQQNHKSRGIRHIFGCCCSMSSNDVLHLSMLPSSNRFRPLYHSTKNKEYLNDNDSDENEDERQQPFQIVKCSLQKN